MKQKLPIILFGVLGVVLLWYFFYSNSATPKSKFQWKENYRATSSEPYGTLFIKELLESYKDESGFVYNDSKPLRKVLEEEKREDTTAYVFIGKSIYLEKTDRRSLLAFIEEGNHAFISSLEAPFDLLSDMNYFGCDDYLYYNVELSESVTVNFFKDSLRTTSGYTYTFRQGPKNESYSWPYINEGFFCLPEETKVELYPIGHFGDTTINFLKIRYGKGSIYLHTNPILFTNYFMTQEEKLGYVSTVFSHIRGNRIIWDEYSKLPFSGDEPSLNPLYYILKQPSLKYAWWLLIVTALLYIVFVAKRTQRVIPVLATKNNTSLEFVKLVADLHFQNRNNQDMARKKMKYFTYFIRQRYGVHTQDFSETEVQTLAEKSGVNRDSLQGIFYLCRSINNVAHSIDEFTLINFDKAINMFYKQCK